MVQWRWLDQNLTPMAALLNFFFLFEPELTPAGRNLLDGRYSVFATIDRGQRSGRAEGR